MDDRDEWGPWEQRFPSLACLTSRGDKLAPKSPGIVLKPVSKLKTLRKSYIKSPFPAKSICMLDCFNRSYDQPRTQKPGKRHRKVVLETAFQDRGVQKTDFRCSVRIQSVPRRRGSNDRNVRIQTAAQGFPSPRAFAKTLYSTFSPISLALTQNQVLRQETSKVLAGKFQRTCAPTIEKPDLLLDALESKLTHLLENQRNSSLS